MKRLVFLFAMMVTMGVHGQTTTGYGRAESAWIHFLDPVTAMGVGQRVSGTVMLASEAMASVAKSELNDAIADEIKRQLGKYQAMTVSTIDITYYDTPSGSSRSSSRGGRSSRGSRGSRGSSRGDSKGLQGLREVLMDRLGAENVTMTTIPEDWESIIRVTQEQDIRLKQAALDIMRHVSVQQGREQQLMALANGETWRQLQQQVFPNVQRIEYKALLSHQSAGDGNAAVTLEGLYATAKIHSKETKDYYDIIDLAARLFPESAEAAINAAGVALLRGDVQKAASCLRPWQTDSRACLHLGVMYMLRGDRVKAEVQLRLALARGVPEAAAALEALLNGRE